EENDSSIHKFPPMPESDDWNLLRIKMVSKPALPAVKGFTMVATIQSDAAAASPNFSFQLPRFCQSAARRRVAISDFHGTGSWKIVHEHFSAAARKKLV